MPAQETQYHHYIPRFILKHFAHDSTHATTRDSRGVLHVFDVTSRQFYLGTVGKTCGRQNLYCNPEDINSIRIEELLSKLESQAAEVFARVHAAVANGEHHIDIREEHIRVIFKFFNVSLRRTSQYKDEVQDPYRENDFMFQSMFEASNEGRQPVSPSKFWLDNLRYLLESDHDDLFTRTERTTTTAATDTYKFLFENYALQIWKAAKGHEFFLNDRFVDFEGETQSYLGTEATETGHQLIWMTTDDMIHLVLPISPEVAIVLCNESRCWESPFTEILHKLNQPYPQTSLLKSAPHKDIIEVEMPSVKRGRTRRPATTAWRINWSRQILDRSAA